MLVTIDDHNYRDHVKDHVIDGELKKRGLLDYDDFPKGGLRLKSAKPFDLPLIPTSDWKNAFEDQTAKGATLSDARARGMKGERIPSRDQNGKGYCFPPGTLVRMADGSQKRIEEIRVGDQVLRASGTVGVVQQLHARHYEGQLVQVRAWGHSHLKCTPSHPFVTKRGRVKAEDLTSEDWVAVPQYMPQSCSVVQTAEHVKVASAKKLVQAGNAWRETSYKNSMPDLIQLNYNTGRIFGLWLAEGSLEDNRISWSFNANEEDTLAAELIELLQEEWGVAAIGRPNKHNGFVVRLAGSQWAELFESLCGRLSSGKRIHSDLMSGPKEFLKGLLIGWLDGDGCIKQHSQTGVEFQCGCTVSHSLAMSMHDIANWFGLRPTILRERAQENRYAAIRQPTYKLKWVLSPSSKLTSKSGDYRCQVGDKVIWRRIREVTKSSNYSGTVHNIGVEGEHTYVAESLAVYNCWAHSSTSAALLVRAREHQPYVDFSAYAVACMIKHYRDEGGYGGQSLDFIADKGIPSSEYWPQKSMSKDNDKPATWENAKKHRFTEWMDMGAHDMKQLVTCLLLGIPVITDFNWWGHSVCAIRVVELHPTDEHADIMIWNSWGDGWSEHGEGVLKGNKARPDGQWAPRVMTGSFV